MESSSCVNKLPPPARQSVPPFSSSFLASFCNGPFVEEFAKKFAKNPVMQKAIDLLQSGKFNEEELFPSNGMDADALELEAAAKEYMEGLLERHPSMKKEFHKINKYIRKDPAYKSFADNTESTTALMRYFNSNTGKALGFGAEKSIHQDASLGDVEGLKGALKAFPDINKKDSKGMTALVVACAFGKSRCARILIEAGAEVNAFDENGNTPLHYAALNGMKNCVWHLLKHGADITWQNNKGLTPYQFANDAGQSKELLKLIKRPRTWSVVEVDGQSKEVLKSIKRPRKSVSCVGLDHQ